MTRSPSVEFSDQQAFADWQQKEFADEEKPERNPMDSLRQLLSLIVPYGNCPTRWATAARRLALVCHVLDVADCGGRSLTDLSEQLTAAGVETNKATLSAINIAITDHTGFHRTEKTQAARDAYKIAQANFWRKKRESQRA